MLGTQAAAADPGLAAVRGGIRTPQYLARPSLPAGSLGGRSPSGAKRTGGTSGGKRTQWAIDLAMDRDFSRAVVGLVALKHLAASDLCTDEDYEMLDKIGGAKIDALTLSEESARREAAKPRAHGTAAAGTAAPTRETAVRPAPRRGPTSSPLSLESRGERVFATSAGMAKVLAEADRLVSFVASRRSGRRRIGIRAALDNG